MKVILIGQGKLVYFLSKQFISKGYHLTIINQDLAEATIFSRQLKATVIVGDGSNPLVLKEAEAYQADVLLSLTAQDQDNLVACQIAQKHYGVTRTIALVNDPEHQQVFEQLGITVAFSPIELLAHLIEQQTDFEAIRNLVPVAEGKVTVAEVALNYDSPALGKTLQELRLPPGSLIGCILREGAVIVPSGGTSLQVADRLILLSQPEHYSQFLHILTGEGT
jgi:trk system potassium uptake protein TrkA